MVHQFNVSPSFPFAHERDKVIKKARFIKKFYYPNWLANVVMVIKVNVKWRMCVDFTDLNRAYSKNSYPLP